MSEQPYHIVITATLVRLYVFLAQHLDRCLDDAARQSFPEKELQAHLAKTREALGEILSVNRVVKDKVEQECERILTLGAACMTGGPGKTTAMESVKTERAMLQSKTIALSDLLAVFRAEEVSH